MTLLPIEPRARKQALFLMLAVVVATWWSANVYVVRPRQDEAVRAVATLKRLKAQNDAAAPYIYKADSLSAEIAGLERQLRVIEQFVPRAEEVPRLLDAITHEAESTEVEVSRIRPLAAERVELEASPARKTVAPRARS